MTIARNNNGNGQSFSHETKTKKSYIMVVDSAEEIVLIIKHALEVEEEAGHLTNDNPLEEPSVAQRIRRLLNKLSPTNGSAETNVTPLTPRQTQILSHIARGHPNKWIASSLGISEQTVKNHVTSIMEKLDANSRTHAVVSSILNGWLNIEDTSEIRSEQEVSFERC